MSHSFSEAMTDTMNVESLALLVRQTIAKRLRMNTDVIQLETNLQDLNLDSLDLAELLFLLEDELKKPVNVGSGISLVTVADVVEVVKKVV